MFIKLWWAHVTVIPDVNKIIVFSKGIWKGLNVLIPIGGQFIPISIDGDKLLWKNAQKNEIKKKSSEIINKIIPNFKLFWTLDVCIPWNVLSRIISRHHWYNVNKIIIFPRINKFKLFLLNHITNPVIEVIAPIDAVIGHGL